MSYPTPMDIAEAEDREANTMDGVKPIELKALMNDGTSYVVRYYKEADYDDLEKQLAEYENVIIPSWKREEAMWLAEVSGYRAQIAMAEEYLDPYWAAAYFKKYPRPTDGVEGDAT